MVPTRFYFQASGSAPVSPAFDAGWEQTGQAARLPMDVARQASEVTALASSSAITVPITTTQQILCWQFVSRQVFQPVRLDASVTRSMVIRTTESATSANAFLAFVLRAFSADGSAVLATLSSSMTNAGTEFTTAAQTRIFASAAITAATLSQPWRLVLDIGAHAQGPTAAQSYTLRAGCNAASDFALTSGLTTDLNPWLELSADLNAVAFANYQFVRVGSGMGAAEKIR